MPNVQKIVDNSLPRTKEMVCAELSDLFLGKVYYLICGGDKTRVFKEQVRPKVGKQNHWGKEETDEEYGEYKDFLRAMVEDKRILIIK